MVTIYDIAKESGFSVTTVSKALNNYSDVSEKTKRLILHIANEMGYLPNSHARTLTTKKSWMIGVLFAEGMGIGFKHPFFNAVIENFKKRVESQGYDLMFISKDIGGKNISYLEHCRFRSIDGLVIVHSNPNDPELQELLHSSIPCVLLDLETDYTSTVYSDNVNGSMKAVEYLYSLGHRKIAHISGGWDSFAGSKRLKGYTAGLTRVGIQRYDPYIVDGGYFSIEGGYQAMKQLIELDEPPTAVFVASDSMAIGAIKAINDHGLKVPDDFSIIGFDDIELAKFVSPQLTTIRQDTHLLGDKAAEILIEKMERIDIKHSIILPVELIIRESCRRVD